MGTIGKSFALILILIMAISSVGLLAVKPVSAQSIPKPSVPQFTLNLIDSSNIQIIIENQPLILTLSNESLYYNIGVKEHNSDNWIELYTNNRPDLPTLKGTIPIQSDSQNTTLDYPTYGYSKGTELDFQTIAMYGYYYIQEPASHDPLVPSQTAFGVLADGESGWSPTQTITIPASSNLPTSTPTVPEFPITSIFSVLVVLSLLVVTLITIIKRKRNKS